MQSKRLRLTDKDDGDSSSRSAKKSRKSTATKGKGTGKGKEGADGKGGKGSRSSTAKNTPSKAKGTSSKATTKRIGSDKVELRTGGARLGDPYAVYAAGTIVNLDPTVSGGTVSFDDYVLGRFTSIVSGMENMKLTCDVYEVFFSLQLSCSRFEIF